MKKIIFISILIASSFSYSSFFCEDAMRSPEVIPTKDELIKLLEHPDVSVRVSAVAAAEKVGRSALPVLKKAMKNPSETVRLRAVGAVLEMGKPARSLLREVVSVLDQALDNPSDYISTRAFKIASSIPGFLVFLESKKLSIVRKAMEHPDVLVRLRAVEVAFEIDAPARSILESKRISVLYQALEYSIREEPEYNRFTKESLMASLVTGFGVGMRTVALIAKIGEPALPVLKKALTHTNVQTLMEAIEVAVEMGTPARSLLQSERFFVLDQVLEHPLAWMFGSRAVKVAGEIRAIPILRKALVHPNEKIRSAAVEEIKKIGGPALYLLN